MGPEVETGRLLLSMAASPPFCYEGTEGVVNG